MSEAVQKMTHCVSPNLRIDMRRDAPSQIRVFAASGTFSKRIVIDVLSSGASSPFVLDAGLHQQGMGALRREYHHHVTATHVA